MRQFYVIGDMEQAASTVKEQVMPQDQNQLPIELSIVVPTFNEKDNVEKLIERIEQVLPDRKWEIIFIDDDSPDGTADLVRKLAQSKPYVRCHQRIARRGLSKAVSGTHGRPPRQSSLGGASDTQVCEFNPFDPKSVEKFLVKKCTQEHDKRIGTLTRRFATIVTVQYLHLKDLTI